MLRHMEGVVESCDGELRSGERYIEMQTSGSVELKPTWKWRKRPEEILGRRIALDNPLSYPTPSLTTTKVRVRLGVGPKMLFDRGLVIKQADYFLPKNEKKLRSSRGRSLDKAGC